MADLELKGKRWSDGLLDLDFAFVGEAEIRTARMTKGDGDPAFPTGTSLPWLTGLENWCDANEQQIDEWATRLRST